MHHDQQCTCWGWAGWRRGAKDEKVVAVSSDGGGSVVTGGGAGRRGLMGEEDEGGRELEAVRGWGGGAGSRSRGGRWGT